MTSVKQTNSSKYFSASEAKRKRVSLSIEEIICCRKCSQPIYDPPVFKCPNDDMFCRPCHGSLMQDHKECPFCFTRLTNKRSFLAEKILGKLPHTSCHNKGCNKSYAGDEARILHAEEECSLREVICVHCDIPHSIQDLPGHLFKVKGFSPLLHAVYGFGHEAKTRISVDGMWDGRGKSRPFTIVVEGGSGHDDQNSKLHFFLNVCRSKGRYLFWISHGQSKRETKAWRYTIRIFNSSDKKPEFSFSGYCPPADSTLAQIAEEMNILNLSTNFVAANFQGEKDNEITLETKIVRVDEKA